jgi:gluconate 5-dehydrogenase
VDADMSLETRFGLGGKVALVTGGSRGLGLEIARALGEADARVAISARRAEWLTPAESELRAAGIECRAILADVAKEEDASRLVDEVAAAWGELDILVNNAGISWGAPALEVALDQWQKVIDTNVTGTFLMCQAAGRRMAARGGGRIINMSSVAGLLGATPEVLDAVGYNTSKAAIIGLTRDLAVKWARHGILVNVVAPWFVPTRLTQAVIARSQQAMLDRIPLGRLGTPEDVANAVLFLAGPAAAYITGQVLAIDGGVTAS